MKRLTKKQREKRDIEALREKLMLIAQGAVGGCHEDDLTCELTDPDALSRYLSAIQKHFLEGIETEYHKNILLWEIGKFADIDSAAEELYIRGVRP